MKLVRNRRKLRLVAALSLPVFFLDCITPANLIVPFLYVVLIVLFQGKGEARRDVWAMALASAALTLLAPLIGYPTLGAPHWIMWSNRLMVSASILVVAYLLDKQQQAERESSSKDVFLATLAHELRNPVAALSSGIAVLQRMQVNPRNLTELMARQVRHLIRLVDDLLELSRIRGGKIRLRPQQVDPCHLMQAAIDASKSSIEQAGQGLTVSLDSHTPMIEADPVRLTEVFTNLLDNASKFTPKGGSIDVSVKRQGDWVVASVRDNGRGISPEALPTIFGLFTQAESLSPTKGLGIGLALVKEIVELHSGTVEGRSDGLGKGSEFVVSLPVA